MMRRVDANEFLRDPVARCVLEPTFVVWCHSPTLCGSIHWGRPSHADVAALVRLLEFIQHPNLAQADVLMDDRAIEAVDVDVLLGLAERLRARLPEWVPRIRRQVVVLPPGMDSILIAGLLPSLDPGYPFRFVADLATALAYLDRPDAREAHAAAEEIAAAYRSRASVINRLRSALARDLVGPTLPAVAGRLGLSPRSLQRHLREAESTFSDELRRMRVRAAADLLVLTDAKVEDVARRVGFGNASRMSAAFRREVGRTPREVRRDRERRSPP